MANCMVKLRLSQQTVRPFRHPLLDTAKGALTEDQINKLLSAMFEGDKDAKQQLILGHLSMLRHTIGRYLYHWPLTRRFCDEMVSAGLYALTSAVGRLKPDTLGTKILGQYLLNHICKHVEVEIARLRGIVPAPARTNQRRVQTGKEPIFGQVEMDIDRLDVQDGYYYIESRFEAFNVLEAIEQLKGEFEQLDIIFDPEYWDLSDTELAELIDIPRRTISWYRSELLRRYYELIGD